MTIELLFMIGLGVTFGLVFALVNKTIWKLAEKKGSDAAWNFKLVAGGSAGLLILLLWYLGEDWLRQKLSFELWHLGIFAISFGLATVTFFWILKAYRPADFTPSPKIAKSYSKGPRDGKLHNRNLE